MSFRAHLAKSETNPHVVFSYHRFISYDEVKINLQVSFRMGLCPYFEIFLVLTTFTMPDLGERTDIHVKVRCHILQGNPSHKKGEMPLHIMIPVNRFQHTGCSHTLIHQVGIEIRYGGSDGDGFRKVLKGI
jgi:hypothetical protein